MKPEATKVSVELTGGKQLSIETGKLAKQAHGAAAVISGATGPDIIIELKPLLLTCSDSRADRRAGGWRIGDLRFGRRHRRHQPGDAPQP